MRTKLSWLIQPDTINALLFLLFGGGIFFYSITQLPIGTAARLGPGAFPAALGLILMIFGLPVLLTSLSSREEPIRVPLRMPIFMLGSVLAFGLLMPLFGALPSIAAMTVISMLAETGRSPRIIAAVAAVLCLIAWLIFSVALGLTFKMYDWPF